MEHDNKFPLSCLPATGSTTPTGGTNGQNRPRRGLALPVLPFEQVSSTIAVSGDEPPSGVMYPELRAGHACFACPVFASTGGKT